MTFEIASREAVPELVALVNRCYRGEASRAGWSTEADLLDGARIDAAMMDALFDDAGSLIFSVREEDAIIATLHAGREGARAYFGLFAVEPTLQNRGIGKRLLSFAESEVITRWKSERFVMQVLRQREELIAYYERCGYRKTGATEAFPTSELWQPKVADLAFVVLEKAVSENFPA